MNDNQVPGTGSPLGGAIEGSETAVSQIPRMNYRYIPCGNETVDRFVKFVLDSNIKRSIVEYEGELESKERENIDIWISKALEDIRQEFIVMGADPETLQILVPRQFHLFPLDKFEEEKKDDHEALTFDKDRDDVSTILGYILARNFEAKIPVNPNDIVTTKIAIIHEAIHLMSTRVFRTKLPGDYSTPDLLIRLVNKIDETEGDVSIPDLVESLDGQMSSGNTIQQFVNQDIGGGFRFSSHKRKTAFFGELDETFVQYMTMRIVRNNSISLGFGLKAESSFSEFLMSPSTFLGFRPIIFDSILDGLAKARGSDKYRVLCEYARSYLGSSVPSELMSELKRTFGSEVIKVLRQLNPKHSSKFATEKIERGMGKAIDFIAKIGIKPELILELRKFALRRGGIPLLDTKKDYLVYQYLHVKDPKRKKELYKQIMAM